MRLADRIILNVITNYGLTVLGTVASLLMVPVVTAHLGRSGFGLASMVFAVSAIFDLVANSVGRALERYIPLSLAEDNRQRLGRTFNTARAAFLLIGLIGAVAVLLVTGWLTNDAHESPETTSDAKWAFWLLAAYMVVGYPWVCYQKSLGAIQRYDLVGLFTGSTTLVRLILVILVFWMGHGTISFYIGSLLLALLVCGLLCRRSLRRLVPEMPISFRLVDRAGIREVGAFASASLLVVTGNILVTQGFSIFVGKTLGMRELGGLAAVLTIRTLLWTLINNVAGVLTPAVSSMDAQGFDQNISKLFLAGAKYSAMMAVMICGVPLMVAAPFLELWLGPEFKGLNLLLYMLLIAQIPISPGQTSQQVLVGLGRVRVAGLFVFSRGVLALLSAWAYVQWVQPSLTGSAACVFGIQLIGAVVLFLLAAKATQIPWHAALLAVFGRPILFGAVGGAVTWFVAAQLGQHTWWKLITATCVGELVFLILALLVGFTHEEKERLRSFVAKAKHRLMPTLEPVIQATKGKP